MTEEEAVKRFALWLLGLLIFLAVGSVVAVKMGWMERPQIGKISPPSILPQ